MQPGPGMASGHFHAGARRAVGAVHAVPGRLWITPNDAGYNATHGQSPISRVTPKPARSFCWPLLLLHSVPQSPAWTACLLAFERELTPQQFATWIRPLSCADESGRAAA